MRCLGLTFLAGVLAAAQGQPNCSGIALDVDARCACVKDPRSQVCELVKKGFYDSNGIKPVNPGWLTGYRPGVSTGPSPASTRPLLAGESGKKTMSSDFGVELHALIGAALPGTAAGTVAEDKILAVRVGMKRDEVLTLLGPPLSLTAIQGLDEPRETWTYQVPFGKSFSLRLENGVVSQPPR